MRYFRLCTDSGGGTSNEIALTLTGEALAASELAILRAGFTGSGYQIATGLATLELNEGGVTFTITLTPGNYTAVSFAAHLQGVLNALGAANTYAVTISADTGLLTTSITAGAANHAYRFVGFGRMAAIMGYAATNPAIAATTTTSTYPVRLSAAFYYLVSNTCIAGPVTNLVNSRRVAVLAAEGGRFGVNDSLQDETIFYAQREGRAQFSLVDEFGDAVPLNGGLLWVDCLIRH